MTDVVGIVALAIVLFVAVYRMVRRCWDTEARGGYVGPKAPTVTLPPRGGKVIGRIAPARRAP
jgi:hypothetical protein